MALLCLDVVAENGARTERFMEIGDARVGRFLLNQVQLAVEELLPDADEVTVWFEDQAGVRRVLQESTRAEAVASVDDKDPRLKIHLEMPSAVSGAFIIQLSGSDEHSDKAEVQQLELRVAQERPAEVAALAEQMARRLFPEAGSLVIRYEDEEGDQCTLTAGTARDAVATASFDGADRVLTLLAQPLPTGARPEPAARAPPAAAPRITHVFRRSGSGAAGGEGLLAPEPVAEDDAALVAELRRQLEAARQRCAEQQQDIDAARSACVQEVGRFRMELDTQRQAAQDQERASRERERLAVEAADRRFAELRAELAQRESDVAAAKGRRAELEVEAQAATVAAEASALRAKQLDKDLEDCTKALDTARSVARTMTATIDADRAKIADLTRQLQELGDELAKARREHGTDPKISARVLISQPDISGIELAGDDPTGRKDITQACPELLERFAARQVFCVGRARCAVEQDDVPVVYTVTVLNDGEKAWPSTAVLVHVDGDNLGLPLLPMSPESKGEATNVFFELQIPRAKEPRTARSAWVLKDAASGMCLGPVLVFEVEWVLASDFA